jgi:DNA-directed RNA polymerase subunit omega
VHSKNKPAVTALREIAAGKVHFDRNSHDAVEEWIVKHQAAAGV